MILGVDVHAGYGRIDWPAVASSGMRFCYVKCSEGNEPARTDRRFAENVAGCRDTGIYVGAYHFAYPLPPGKPGRSPEEQARAAYAACGGLGTQPGELPPVVDAEWPAIGDWGKWGCTAAQIAEWLHTYCVEAERLWRRRPVIYTYPFWWRTLSASASVAWAREYPLWIASYKDITEWQPRPETAPHSVQPWDGDWTFWQFSADKSPVQVPGIQAAAVDRNVFRGDLDGLRRLAGIDPEAVTVRELPSRRPPSVEDFAIVHPDVPVRGFED